MEPSTRIKDVLALATGARLDHETDLPFAHLAGGIRVVCDQKIDPVTISQQTCYVTLDLPFPFDEAGRQIWRGRPLGFQPLVLSVTPSIDGTDIIWLPDEDTRNLLSSTEFQ